MDKCPDCGRKMRVVGKVTHSYFCDHCYEEKKRKERAHMSDRYFFRGKRADNMEWVEGIYLFIRGRTFILLNSSGYSRTAFMDEDIFEVIPETVGQSTGLKDKNGVEIFESDICKYLDDADKEQIGVVEYSDVACGYYLIAVGGDDEGNQDIQLHKNYDIGKVGNIHDNPELLEGA